LLYFKSFIKGVKVITMTSSTIKIYILKFVSVQITIETMAFPLQALPFPAVTVCSPTYDKMGFTQK